MSPSREGEQTPAKKPWNTPELREQSVLSLTEGKPYTYPVETPPDDGPS